MALILVVDDEPDIRYLTQVNLELDGHRVMTAANGEEALAAVQVEPPDLVILDVMMPKVDGWQVLEGIKASMASDVSEIRVLMMTALGSDTDQIRGGIEGAIQYLVKPVAPEELRRTVLEALDAGPEPELRRRAQTSALTRIAANERGGPPIAQDEPRPRLSNLERQRPIAETEPAGPTFDASSLEHLTDKQRALLDTLRNARSVSVAATELAVSRSNIYASLRRIARKLDIESVPELLSRLRAGEIPGD